jgi:hypothetical protein
LHKRLTLLVIILVLAARGSTGGAFARQPIEEVPRSGVPPHSPESQGRPVAPGIGLEVIDTGFENASPVWYETAPDGVTQVYLMYDRERNSPNRAAGHFHFRLHAHG